LRTRRPDTLTLVRDARASAKQRDHLADALGSRRVANGLGLELYGDELAVFNGAPLT